MKASATRIIYFISSPRQVRYKAYRPESPQERESRPKDYSITDSCFVAESRGLGLGLYQALKEKSFLEQSFYLGHQIKFYLGRWREYYCSTDSSVGTQSGFRLLFPPLLSVSEAAIYLLYYNYKGGNRRPPCAGSYWSGSLSHPLRIQQELETRDQCLVPRSFCIFLKRKGYKITLSVSVAFL